MNKQMLESFDRMYKKEGKKLRESSSIDKIAFIDVSGSNSAPDMLKVSEKLAKDAGAQTLMYFADKISKTPNGLGGGTYYKPIQKYLDDNNISKAIVVTDADVEMNEDGKDLQKDSRVTIIRNDEYEDEDLDESINTKKQNSLKSLKESLGTAKYNKIQKLIKECLKEGMEVEITIPKKRK